MLKTESPKLGGEPLTDLRVSEAGRSNLYTCRAHGDVFKHIGGRLDAAQADNWDFHSFPRLPNQAERDRSDGGAAQTTGLISYAGFPAAEGYGQSGAGHRKGESVGPCRLA